ncbi:MAG: nuclear transport factor 2 family protein, partial [Steroidobacteraceae bacterium]
SARHGLAGCLLGATLALLVFAPPVSARDTGAVRVVKRYMDAMRSMDRLAVDALIAPDAVFEYPYSRSGSTEPGAGRRYVGKEAIMRDYVGRAFDILLRIDWTEPVFTPSADGRTVFVEARGDMVLVNDVPYRNQYVIRFDVEGGRIRHMAEYMNTVTAGQALEQAGLLPKP